MRIYIYRLAYDAVYADALLPLIRQLGFITEARINATARSLIVQYSPDWSASVVFDQVRTTIQQAAICSIFQRSISPLPASANLRGIGWMLLATGCFAGMQASIQLVSGAIHPFQIAFLSHLIGIVILSPWIVNSTALQTEKFSLHLLRAVIDVGATLLMFTSLTLIPLAQANAIGFTAPLFAMLGAIVFLGEQAQTHTWVSLLLGVVGMLVILRPGLEIVSLGALMMLAGSAALGGVLLIIKILAQTDSNLSINAYTVLLLTPLLLIPALLVWQIPTTIDLIGFTLIAALMVGGHTAMTQAFVEAEMVTVLPVEFVQLLWASGLGFLLFSEVPNLWTVVGGLLIFGGSTYAAYQENSSAEVGDGAAQLSGDSTAAPCSM